MFLFAIEQETKTASFPQEEAADSERNVLLTRNTMDFSEAGI